ncbi:MAG: hypothetical protein HY979_02230 [Candidatus Magasanikbacteria bacterium]|nr:hypothetical protein [Candidatus Magasanikbacteria bacterium]
MTSLAEAKKIMGRNFIGFNEIKHFSSYLPLDFSFIIPAIPYGPEFLKDKQKDFLLILGCKNTKDGSLLTIKKIRDTFGVDPMKKEACLYNQDWYLNEKFIKNQTLKNQWYLIRKKVLYDTRGIDPDVKPSVILKKESLPSAILATYTFFVYYYLTGGIKLWKHNFIWCNDRDHNGDRIYVGRYEDPKKINKNGFNIHRHLSISKVFACITQIPL